MLKALGVLAALAVAGLLIFAAFKPNTFRVQRALGIKAPPEKIFALINDFHQWGAWSPYEKLDPAMTRTFSGEPSGKGAVYTWAGNMKAGQGRMEITESVLPGRIVIQLDFSAPMHASNTAEFTLVREGDITNVTWAMYGPMSYLHKVMGTFFSMDNMVGSAFAAGLANLKTAAEK
jgi:uncharacterized protein YndB with AHSA1/START domain